MAKRLPRRDALITLADRATPQARRRILDAWAAATDAVRPGSGETRSVILMERTAMSAWTEEAMPRLASAMRDLVQEVSLPAGRATWATIEAGAAWRYDAVNPRAVEAARSLVGDLIVEISQGQRESVRQVITRVTSGEIAISTAARRLRDVVGLTARMEMSLHRYVADARARGVSAARAEVLGDRYRAKLLKTRAETIARTESVKALNLGRVEAWKQARDQGLLSREAQKKWTVTWDDRLCPVCAPMAGETVPLDGVFDGGVDGPPRHPRCRCALTLIRRPDARAVR